MANESSAYNGGERKEWVAVIHGQGGTWKIAAMNATSMVQLLAEQTTAGNMVVSVYERVAQIYTQEEVGR